MKTCPCESGNTLNECCGRYLSESERPDTPEALMRSRYTAYTMANIPYIQATMRGRAAEGYDPESARDWARSSKWHGLKILSSRMDGNDRGFVEFVARFTHAGRLQEIHEISEFHRIEDSWYYVDGRLPADDAQLSLT